VLYAIGERKALEQLSLEELRAVSSVFDESLFEAITVETCVNARKISGGPAESAVLEALNSAEGFLRCVKNVTVHA
jgi:argininosuccinate lyase